jgi:CelD/BcsL family acetyltransferase involved in cellulose biosynthesis
MTGGAGRVWASWCCRLRRIHCRSCRWCRNRRYLVDGEVVASRIGFVLDDSLYLYFSGYLPKMSRYSVMTTCTVEAIKWAIAKGFQTINLSTGRDQSKLRWRPTEVSLIEAQVVSPSWRGAVFHQFNYAVKQRVPEVAALPGGLGSFVKLIKRRQ